MLLFRRAARLRETADQICDAEPWSVTGQMAIEGRPEQGTL